MCKGASAYTAKYEAGNIDTLIRIVDANGGLTIIPENMIDSRLKTFAIMTIRNSYNSETGEKFRHPWPPVAS